MGNLIVIHTYIRLYINNLKQIKMIEALIVLTIIVMIALVVFVSKMTMRMAAQLSPDAQLKPVKTVLIEGEYLDILTEPELIPDTT